ncbi:glycoside hydrolase family 13 protein [Paraoerskovia sediminicola]|nr:glycoside hydrolase family 13 protein [Paraoerskovia sediminicola]
MRDGIVYQVFPDRFARSAAAADRDLPGWALPADWDTPVIPEGPGVGTQLYGGDLAGVEEHLDHLVDLGVGTLYLTPFFPGRSNHRYDASTFAHVDPLLGGDEALASLTRAAHARGLRVMGDITTNHTGAGHEWFVAALADPQAPERDLYYWTDGGYVSWLEHDSLPKLDWASPQVAEKMLHGADAPVRRYLEAPFDLDGWRVDVANMTGRHAAQDDTHEVAREVRRAITDVRADGALVGEHFHDASGDLAGDGWHANMNYSAFTRPIWTWLAPEGSQVPYLGLPVTMPRRSGPDVVATMREFDAVVPWAVASRQWNMLGSHDTARLRTVVGGPEMVEVAAAVLMTYPGTPVVFAGDELGLEGVNGEHSRVPMPWGRLELQDAATHDTYRSLVRLRRESRALREGGMRWVHVDDDALVYLRETADERVLVVAARGPWSGAVVTGLAVDGFPERLFGGVPLQVEPDGVRVAGDGPAVGVWRLPAQTG